MKINKTSGLIKMIIVIVIAIIILSYYNVNLRSVFTSSQVQDNLGYVWGLVVDAWNIFFQYILNPILGLLHLRISGN